MGNTASSTPASGEASVDSSGVTLSPRLQAKIVQDFQTRVQAEWLQRSDNIKQQEQANSELSKEHKTFLDQSNKAQATLDQRYEKLDAVFHDQVVAADYDASALQQKYQVKVRKTLLRKDMNSFRLRDKKKKKRVTDSHVFCFFVFRKSSDKNLRAPTFETITPLANKISLRKDVPFTFRHWKIALAKPSHQKTTNFSGFLHSNGKNFLS